MKRKFLPQAAFAGLALTLPSHADVIYSGQLGTPGITIPTDFDGVDVTIEDGVLNFFFGGVGIANNDKLQPFRDGTGGLDTLLKFDGAQIISGSSGSLASGFGGSQDHLGDTFTAGQEGYIGFKLEDSGYGWVRVVLTNNASGALVKDWAYNSTSNGTIATGNVIQDGSTFTLDSSAQSFALGSAITGANSVLVQGGNTVTLNATNTYTGATTVSAGTLYVNGSLGSSAVTVEANGILGGNGTLGNGLTIEAGGKLDLTGATLGLNSTDILNLTGGSLTLGNLTFQDLVGWNWANADNGTYQLIAGNFTIDWGGTTYLSEATAYDFGNGKSGYFESGSLSVVVIPEPRAALLGGLGLIILLRRRRF